MVSRVPSIQKFFSSGWVRPSPAWPEEFWMGRNVPLVQGLLPAVLEALPLKSYVMPHGVPPLKPEL